MNSSKKSHKVKRQERLTSEVKIREGRIAEGAVTLVYRSRVWLGKSFSPLHMNMGWKCRHEKVPTRGREGEGTQKRKEGPRNQGTRS